MFDRTMPSPRWVTEWIGLPFEPLSDEVQAGERFDQCVGLYPLLWLYAS